MKKTAAVVLCAAMMLTACGGASTTETTATGSQAAGSLRIDSLKSGAPFRAALARCAARLPDGVSVHGADDGAVGR